MIHDYAGYFIHSEANKLRLDLKEIYEWFLDCQMLFNVDKCIIIHMRRNRLI